MNPSTAGQKAETAALRRVSAHVAPDEERCVFLSGAPRSGTTYVQLLLFASGAFATSQETHLFTAFLGRLEEAWERFAERAADHRAVGLPAVISRTEFDGLMRSFAMNVLSEVGRRYPGASWILEKTPENALHWTMIVQLIPKARFITVVRDPRAVVASTLAARTWAGDWARRDVAQITENWIRSIQACLALEAGHPHVTRIRFESLRAQTAKILGSVLAKFDVHLAPERIARLIESVAIQELQTGRFDAPWSLKGEPDEFFRSGSATAWRQELPVAAIALIEQLARDEMRILGYAPVVRLGESPGA